jgi:hypothetical protein
MTKQSKIPWNRETWDKTKVEIKKLTGNWDMTNQEIQEKLLELAEKQNRGL